MRVPIRTIWGPFIVICAFLSRLFVLPNRQMGQVFVGDVGVIGIGWVREDLALLLLALGYQIVQLGLQLAELLLVFEDFEVAIALFRVHISERIQRRGFPRGARRVRPTVLISRLLGHILLLRKHFLGPLLVPFPPCDRARALPANIVLADLEDELDALKDVCDVVDASFLDAQGLNSLIEVEDLFGRTLKQIDEALGQLDQAVFFPAVLHTALLIVRLVVRVVVGIALTHVVHSRALNQMRALL